MRALREEALDAAWASAGALIGDERVRHPLGGCGPRVEGRACFDSIVVRLATGCSWDAAAILSPASVSATTLRRPYKAWSIAGVFDWVAEEAIESHDRIVGLDHYSAACGGRVGAQSPLRRARNRQKPSRQSQIRVEAVAAERRCGDPAGMGGRHRRSSRLQTAGPHPGVR